MSLRKEIDKLKSGDFYNYFRFCPLCYDEDSVEAQISTGLFGGADYGTCTSCGAKWQVSLGTFDRKLTAAKLIIDGVDRRGAQFVGTPYRPEDWQQLALRGRRTVASTTTTSQVVVKEIVREVVLISCKHCGTRSPQGSPRCASCGANL